MIKLATKDGWFFVNWDNVLGINSTGKTTCEIILTGNISFDIEESAEDVERKLEDLFN